MLSSICKFSRGFDLMKMKAIITLLAAALGFASAGYAGSYTYTCPQFVKHTFTSTNNYSVTINGVIWWLYPAPQKKTTLMYVSTNNNVTAVPPVPSMEPFLACQGKSAVSSSPVILTTNS